MSDLPHDWRDQLNIREQITRIDRSIDEAGKAPCRGQGSSTEIPGSSSSEPSSQPSQPDCRRSWTALGDCTTNPKRAAVASEAQQRTPASTEKEPRLNA